MRIRIIFTGKTQSAEIKHVTYKYFDRLRKYISIEIIEIPDEKNRGKISVKELKKKESKSILKKISDNEKLVILDENGKNFNSTEFATFINTKLMGGIKVLTFIVGGAWGFDDTLYNRADYKLSLSKMTFSHQIVRVLFAEQLYRAFTIIRNEPYHND